MESMAKIVSTLLLTKTKVEELSPKKQSVFKSFGALSIYSTYGGRRLSCLYQVKIFKLVIEEFQETLDKDSVLFEELQIQVDEYNAMIIELETESAIQ